VYVTPVSFELSASTFYPATQLHFAQPLNKDSPTTSTKWPVRGSPEWYYTTTYLRYSIQLKELKKEVKAVGDAIIQSRLFPSVE
jgi:hypothetical protein